MRAGEGGREEQSFQPFGGPGQALLSTCALRHRRSGAIARVTKQSSRCSLCSS